MVSPRVILGISLITGVALASRKWWWRARPASATPYPRATPSDADLPARAQVQRRTGVLLVNTGTPDSPSPYDVRRYLREFLMDRRVIDIPFLPRWLLVNLIIAPFRCYTSARLYRRIFTECGSPLKTHGLEVAARLQTELGDGFKVLLAMRYQSPSLAAAVQALYEAGVDHVVLLPLFPQYASASSGSVIDRFLQLVSHWWRLPHLSIVSNFWDEEGFLHAWEMRGRPYLAAAKYDLVVFSYHGVPERHILKGNCGAHCRLSDGCCRQPHPRNTFCYRAQCLRTSEALAERLGLQPGEYETAFQSRLGRDDWLRPYLQDQLHSFVRRGKTKVLVFSPSFVADCLETTSELGMEARADFLALGGERWDLVPSLNSDPAWVQCLRTLVLRLDAARRPPSLAQPR